MLLPVILLLCFFLVFLLAITPVTSSAENFAVSFMWFVTFASLMMSVERMYREDKDQGTLDFIGSDVSTALIAIFARIFAHWFVIALPLCVVSIFAGLLFGLQAQHIMLVLISLASGSLSLVCLGAVIAALCVSAEKATMLIGILLFPLLVPVVIFGTQVIHQQLDKGWQLCMLLIGSGCINLVVCPLLARVALLASIE